VNQDEGCTYSILPVSGSYPAAGRPGSGFLVEHRDTRVWLDAGPGTFNALATLGDPLDLTAVVISHIHADHSTDLFALYHYLTYGPRRRRGLPLYAPREAIDHLAAFVGRSEEFDQTFTAITVGSGDSAAVGDLELSFAPTAHSVPTVATRLEADGKSICYSADTGPGGGFGDLAGGCSLALIEATYQGDGSEDPYPYHLTATDAGTVARQAEADRLVLTHLLAHHDPSRSCEEAETTFGRTVQWAVPGLEFRI